MNKSDEWYIKEAVRLADGWDAHETANSFYCKGFGWYSPEMGFDKYGRDRWFFDALAAQLVRQIDGLVIYRLRIEPTGVDIECEGTGKRIAEARFGGDRTMNTIRAIVDSELLGATE